jgi:putative oxidoreductase
MNGGGKREKMESLTVVLGRLLIGQIFLLAGIHKMMDWQGTTAYMASVGMPWIPFFLVGAMLVETLGGLSVIFGIQTRIGALVLTAFLVPTTLLFHDFWTLEDPQRSLQMIMFQKNLAIMGGLILLSALSPERSGQGKG